MKYLLFWFCCLPGFCLAQKIEQESRVDEHEVPERAINFIQQTPLPAVKWYKEMGNHGTSFEAKTKYKKYRYSIEFSEDGEIEDIEKTIKWKELDPAVLDRIASYFEQRTDRFKIIKTQAQWVGEEAKLIHLIGHEEAPHNFEIVVKVKIAKNYSTREYLFGDHGQFIHEEEIIDQPIDYLVN